MLNRLQRLDSESRSRASSRHNPIHIRRGASAQHHRVSQPELKRRWLLLLTKVRMMRSYFDQRRRLIYILGLDATTLESSDAQGTHVLKSMMRGSVEEDPDHQEVAPAQRPNHARIIGQEVMGKFIDKTNQSKGTPVDEVETCPHPMEDLELAQAGKRLPTGRRVFFDGSSARDVTVVGRGRFSSRTRTNAWTIPTPSISNVLTWV